MSARPITRLAVLLLALAVAACGEAREHAPKTPVYVNDIQRLLVERCADCHSGDDAGGGFRVDSYLDTLGCPTRTPEQSAARASDAGIPLLDILDRPSHAKLLDDAERARLRAFLAADLPLRANTVHRGGVLNPASPDWHGRLAAQDHYGPLLEASHPDVCGRCHDGAPLKPKGFVQAAPGATACTTCHREPEGVLACGTCHGDGAARAYPPRDRCLFPPAAGSTAGDAHRAHLTSTRLQPTTLTCSTCHPKADATLSGTHANGKVDVSFDPLRAGKAASYDPATSACAVSCHDQGGARAMPSFHEPTKMACGDCHGAPPKAHFAGPCNRCHADANGTGTALVRTDLHMNGRIDLGDASDGCASCHGQAGDPMPQTPSHLLHRDTQLTAAIVCSDCHTVPKTVNSAGHLDRGEVTPADVTFGARAKARGRAPSYAKHTCREIACHGAGLPDGLARDRLWDEPAVGACSGCHGLPPPRSHPQDSGCSQLICHGSEVTADSHAPRITSQGRSRHIDGHFDTQSP